MKEGLGEFRIELTAGLPPAAGASRRLIFENHHQGRISAYLVNCLVPADKSIHIDAQNRNEYQSSYELDYQQSASPWQSMFRASLAALALLPPLGHAARPVQIRVAASRPS